MAEALPLWQAQVCMTRHHEVDETQDEAVRPLSAEVVSALVQNHREFLAFLERRVGDRTVAEDLLQEAFVRGIERADTVQNQEAVAAWFYRTLRNAVVDHYRRTGAGARAMAAAAAELPTAE